MRVVLTSCRNNEGGVSNVNRDLQQVEQVRKLDAHGSVPYVAEALTRLREEVGNQSTVLGFVGAPFTLATYIVEGGSSKNYTHMKRLMFTQPEVLHAFLTKMADNVADYVRYQVRQIFCVCQMWIQHPTLCCGMAYYLFDCISCSE